MTTERAGDDVTREFCGFCTAGTYIRPGRDGRPDGFTYTCPYCDGTGYVQDADADA